MIKWYFYTMTDPPVIVDIITVPENSVNYSHMDAFRTPLEIICGKEITWSRNKDKFI